MRAAILCLLLAVVAVSGDLYSDLDDIAREMPAKEIAAITQKYLKNSQSFRDYIAFIKSKDLSLVTKAVFDMEEFRSLVDYFQNRGIDFERIFSNWIKATQEWFKQLPEQETESLEVQSGIPLSFANYITEINAAVARSRVSEVVREKMESSAEFGNYVEAVQGPEFQELHQRFVARLFADNCVDCHPQMRGFFSKVWKKIKDIGFGVGVSIPLGK